MKTLRMLLIAVILVVMVNLIGLEVKFDVVCHEIDEFTGASNYIYSTKDINGYMSSFILSMSDDNDVMLTFVNKQDTWELLGESTIAYFLIDGSRYKKTWAMMDTSAESKYVIEFATVFIDKDFLKIIADSKECKVRLGTMKITYISQSYKDGMREFLQTAK